MSTVASHILIGFGDTAVIVPRPQEVRDYLEPHRGLGEFLPQLCATARSVFGDVAELCLELYRDPEVDDSYLTLFVRLPSYDTTFLKRLNELNEQCADALAQQTGQVLVTSDFRHPRAKNGV